MQLRIHNANFNSTIFTTKNKELAIFGNTITNIKEKWDNFKETLNVNDGKLFGENGAFASLFSGKKTDNILTPEVLSQFDEFKEKFNSSVLSAEALAEQMENVDRRIIDYAKTCKNGEMTTEGFKTSVEGLSFSAQTATKALSIAGNMIAMWAISKGLELAVKGIDNLIHSSEKCKERVDELISSYQSALDKANSNAKTAENLASRYEELSKGVNNLGQNLSLTTEEYTEYNDLVNQIAGMFPQLIQGYTDEGNAILSLKGNVKQLQDAYKDAQQEAYSMLVISGRDSDGNDILKNADTVLNGNRLNDSRLKQVAFIDEIEDALYDTEKLTALWRSLKDRNLSYSSWFVDYTGLYDARDIKNLTADDISGIQNELETVKKKYQAEIDDAVSSTRIMLEAYLKADDLYGELDEESARIASILVNSIDAEIAAAFKNDPSAVNDYVQNILEAVNNPNIHDSLIRLFTLDTKDMSVEDAKTAVDDYIHDIAAVLGENEYELKVRLGFEDVDATYKMLHHAVRSITSTGDPLLAIANVGEYNELLSEINWKEFTKEEAEFFVTATREAKNATEAIRMYRDALKETVTANNTTPLSLTQTVAQINTQLRSAFDSLQSAYQEIFTFDEETGEKIFAPLAETDITDKFKPILDALKELDNLDGIDVNYSAYEDFVSVLADTSSTSEDVQEQFNKLATDIIYTSDCTNMSAETFHLLAKSLSEMGITNAYETLERIRNAQEELAALSYDAETAIIEEGKSITELGLASAVTEEYLRHYLLQKNLAQNPLNTLDDVTELEKLCNALGVTGEMLEAVNILKAALNAKENGNVFGSGVDEAIKRARQKIEEFTNGDFSFGFEFNGLSNSSKSGSSSFSAKNTIETFDWTTTAIDRVEKEIEALDEIANSAYSTFSQKNEALAQEIGKVSEEIALQQQAYAAYSSRAEAVGLSDRYKSLIQNGSLDIEDITDEALQEQIDEYQKWYDRAQETQSKLNELQKQSQNLYVTSYENCVNELENLRDSQAISEREYLDQMNALWNQYYADQIEYAVQAKETKLKLLNEEKGYLESVANAAVDLLSGQTDELKARQEAETALLEANKQPLEDQLELLEKQKDKEDRILALQKAQYELKRAENQRGRLTFADGQMVYRADENGLRNAKETVENAKLDIVKADIQGRIDAYDREIDQINKRYEAEITNIERLKNEWQDALALQDRTRYAVNFESMFGEGSITQLLSGDLSMINTWKQTYLDTLSGIDIISNGAVGDITAKYAELTGLDLSGVTEQVKTTASQFDTVNDAVNRLSSAISSESSDESTPPQTDGRHTDRTQPESLISAIKSTYDTASEVLPKEAGMMNAITEAANNAIAAIQELRSAIESLSALSVNTTGIPIFGNAYASGTGHAKKGLAVVGEKKPEIVITNDQKAFLAKQPTLLHMEGGETVLDGNETAKLLQARGLQPITADKSPLLRVLNQYSPAEIRERFAPNMISPVHAVSSSAIQNAGHAFGSSSVNSPSYTTGDIHIHCPGITKDEVAKQIGTELTNVFHGMSLNAYQRINITR